MILNTRQDDGEFQVQLASKFGFNDHRAFRDALTQVGSSGCATGVLDLSRLQSIDSAGLGMLLIAAETARKAKWTLVIRNPQGQVKRMLEIADLGKVLDIQP